MTKIVNPKKKYQKNCLNQSNIFQESKMECMK